MITESYPLMSGGEEVRNERELLRRVEDGTLMNGADSVRFIVIHCSATRCDRDYTVEQLLRDHKVRGFRTIGYHFYITRDGYLHRCRPVNQIGAHAAGWNDRSIGICYEGGLDEAGTPSDTRTYAQKCSLLDLLRQLRRDYPEAKIVGHCQLSPYIRKACPCFDAREEYAGLEEEVSRK